MGHRSTVKFTHCETCKLLWIFTLYVCVKIMQAFVKLSYFFRQITCTSKTGNFRQMWFCSDWYLYFWFRYSDQGISGVEEMSSHHISTKKWRNRVHLWMDENVTMTQKPTWSLYNISTNSITMQATIINRKLLYKWLCWTILTMLPMELDIHSGIPLQFYLTFINMLCNSASLLQTLHEG
jgi:hypothetical protein